MEEFGVISNTRLINTCSTVIKNKFSYAYPQQDFPYRANNILECEFFLLENMDCCLVVFQPYRPLVQYCQVRRVMNALFRWEPGRAGCNMSPDGITLS